MSDCYSPAPRIEIIEVQKVYFPTHKLLVDGVEVGWGHGEASLYALRDELLASSAKATRVREIMREVRE